MFLAPKVAIELLGYWPKLPLPEDLAGLEDSLSRCLIYPPGKLVLIIGRRNPLPHHVDISLELFVSLWCNSFATDSEPAKEKQYFMTYHGKVTLILTTCNCLHKSAMFTEREVYMRTRKSGGRDH